MKLIPTWEDFKKYTIPSKATYIGLVIAVVMIPFTVIPPLHDFVGYMVWLTLGKYDIRLLNKLPTQLRFSVTNNRSQTVYIYNAWFVADLYPKDGHPTSRIAVTAFTLDGVQTPFPVSPGATVSADVDARSYNLSDKSGWDLAWANYRRDTFLQALADSNDQGGGFICSLAVSIRYAEDEETFPVRQGDAAICDVMTRVLGDFTEYQVGRSRHHDLLRPPGYRGR